MKSYCQKCKEKYRQKVEYKHVGKSCPYCEVKKLTASENIVVGSKIWPWEQVYQELVHCQKCFKWYLVCGLTSITKKPSCCGETLVNTSYASLQGSKYGGLMFVEKSNDNIPRIKGYTIIEKIGDGAMGKVFLAYENTLQRKVALKVCRDSGINFQRFAEEIKNLAKIKSVNVVALYKHGKTEEGIPFFTMEWIDGKNIVIFMEQQSYRNIAEIFKTLAQTLHEIHKHKIIHRDLKPSNILVTEDGKPIIIDFGISCLSDERTILTNTGQIMGTPHYMSPEQIDAKKNVSNLSDIFSLGVILYEILTRELPFAGDLGLTQLYNQILKKPPKRLRENKPNIPIELEAICMKCLEKEPEKRYRTASELAKDLTNFLEYRPIIAKKYNLWLRLWKFVLRHKVLTTTASVILVIVIISSILFFKQYQETQKQRTNYQWELTKSQAHASQKLFQEQQIFAAKIMAHRSLLTGKSLIDYPKSKEFTDAYETVFHGPDYRLIWQSPTHRHHQTSITSAQFSPVDSVIASASFDGVVNLSNIKTGKIELLTKNATPIHKVAFSNDGKILAISGSDPAIELWNIAKREKIKILRGHTEPVYHLDFAIQDQRLISASAGEVWLWKVSSGLGFSKRYTSIRAVKFHPQNSNIFAIASDNELKLIDISNNQWFEISTFDNSFQISCLAFRKDGKYIAFGDQRGQLGIWDGFEKTVKCWQAHKDTVSDIIWLDSSTQIVSSGRDGEVKQWQNLEENLPLTLQKTFIHAAPVTNISLSRDKKSLVCADSEGILRLLQIAGKKANNSLSGHVAAVTCVQYNNDGSIMATASLDGSLRFWDGLGDSDNKPNLVLDCGAPIKSIAFSPIKTELVACSKQRSIKLWNITSGELLASWLSPTAIYELCFSPDGKIIAGAGFGEQVVLWDAATGKHLKTLIKDRKVLTKDLLQINPPHSWYSLCFSPEGKMLAAAGTGGEVSIWDVAKAEEVQSLTANAMVYRVRFSGNKHRIATANGDGSINLWRIESEEKPYTRFHDKQSLISHGGIVYDICFDSINAHGDSDTLTSAGADGKIRIWSLRDQELIAIMEWEKKAVLSIDLHPQGKFLASAGEDHSCKIWLVGMEQQKATLKGHLFDVEDIDFGHYKGQDLLVSASRNRFFLPRSYINYWSLPEGKKLLSIHKPGQPYSVSFHPQGHIIASASDALYKPVPEISIWQTLTSERFKILRGHNAQHRMIKFTNDGKYLISTSDDSTVLIWDWQNSSEPLPLPLSHKNSVFDLAISKDNRLLASASADTTIKIWDLHLNKPTIALEKHVLLGFSGSVYTVDFNSKYTIAAGYDNGEIHLWNGQTGKRIAILQGHSQPVRCVNFHPNDKILISASDDFTIKIWDLTRQKVIATMIGHAQKVLRAKFHNSGMYFASSGADDVIKLWEISKPLTSLQLYQALPDYSHYASWYVVEASSVHPCSNQFISNNLYKPRTMKVISTILPQTLSGEKDED